MRAILLLLSSVVFMSGFPAPAQAQWVQANGPYTGCTLWNFHALGNTLYATGKGLFRTTNYGDSWIDIGENHGELYRSFACVSAVATETGDTLIFAGTHVDGGYVSSDRGKSWRALDESLYRNTILDIAVFPNEEGTTTILLAADDIMKSTDYGSTWSVVSQPWTDEVEHFAVDGNYVYAGGDEVMRSTDYGETWLEPSPSSEMIGNVSRIAVAKSYVYAAAEYGLGSAYGGGLFRSSDHGATWEAVNQDFPKNMVRDFLICPDGSGGEYLIAAARGGVFLSSNEGQTWTNIGSELVEGLGLGMILDGSGMPILYASTANEGVFRTTNFGQEWERVNVGLAGFEVQDIFATYSDTEGPVMYAGLKTPGLFKSTDYGQSWKHFSHDLQSLYVNAVASGRARDGRQYLVASSNYYGITMAENEDSIFTWSNRVSIYGGILEFAVDGQDLPVLYASGANTVYRNLLDQSGWENITSHFPSPGNVSDFAYHRDAAGTARVFAAQLGRGVARSEDNGNTWEQISNGIADKLVFALAVLHPENNVPDLFALTQNSILYRSTDFGESWFDAGPLPLNDVQHMCTDGRNLFIANGRNAVFVSEDMGANWKSINQGLELLLITELTTDGQTLFAGTWMDEIWMRPISEVITASEPVESPSAVALAQNYPNPVSLTSATTIPYSLAAPGHVTLTVYNILGVRVATLVERDMPPGSHTALFSPGNLPPGVYTYRLTTGTAMQERSLVVIE